ncbi:MAG: CvpA family protein [Firmicutes bacterium]|nr:CvpA family protein [Bacillota bacterium]
MEILSSTENLSSMLSILIWAPLIFFAVFGFMFGFIRGLRKSVTRIIAIVIVGIAALVLARLISGMFADAGSFVFDGMDEGGAMGVFLNSFDSAALAIFGAIAALVIFILLFFALQFITVFINLFFRSDTRDRGDRKARRHSRLMGGAVGILQGFIITIFVLVPVTGAISIAREMDERMDFQAFAQEFSDNNGDDENGFDLAELATAFDEFTGSAAVRVMSGGPLSRWMFDFLTTTTLRGQHQEVRWRLSDELMVVADVVGLMRGLDRARYVDDDGNYVPLTDDVGAQIVIDGVPQYEMTTDVDWNIARLNFDIFRQIAVRVLDSATISFFIDEAASVIRDEASFDEYGRDIIEQIMYDEETGEVSNMAPVIRQALFAIDVAGLRRDINAVINIAVMLQAVGVFTDIWDNEEECYCCDPDRIHIPDVEAGYIVCSVCDPDSSDTLATVMQALVNSQNKYEYTPVRAPPGTEPTQIVIGNEPVNALRYFLHNLLSVGILRNVLPELVEIMGEFISDAATGGLYDNGDYHYNNGGYGGGSNGGNNGSSGGGVPDLNVGGHGITDAQRASDAFWAAEAGVLERLIIAFNDATAMFGEGAGEGEIDGLPLVELGVALDLFYQSFLFKSIYLAMVENQFDEAGDFKNEIWLTLFIGALLGESGLDSINENIEPQYQHTIYSLIVDFAKTTYRVDDGVTVYAYDEVDGIVQVKWGFTWYVGRTDNQREVGFWEGFFGFFVGLVERGQLLFDLSNDPEYFNFTDDTYRLVLSDANIYTYRGLIDFFADNRARDGILNDILAGFGGNDALEGVDLGGLIAGIDREVEHSALDALIILEHGAIREGEQDDYAAVAITVAVAIAQLEIFALSYMLLETLLASGINLRFGVADTATAGFVQADLDTLQAEIIRIAGANEELRDDLLEFFFPA